MKYTTEQLEAFIERADTLDRIAIAHDFLIKHIGSKEKYLLDILANKEMEILAEDVEDPTGYINILPDPEVIDLEFRL